MQVCFLAHIVQLLLTYEDPAADVDMEVDESTEKGSEAGDGPWLVSMMAHCRSLANIPQIRPHPKHLLDYVKENRFVFFLFFLSLSLPDYGNIYVILDIYYSS